MSKMNIQRIVVSLFVITLLASCASSETATAADEPAEAATEQSGEACVAPAESQTDEPQAADKPEDYKGKITRMAILRGKAKWRMALEQAQPDAEVAKKLAEVEPGAEMTVYLGAWCGDSRREVPRFWKALDIAGEVPFSVRYVGLDTKFDAAEVSLEGKNVRKVPTFVIIRDGQEVGRVVETSPNGIETDVLSLLTGEKTGKISASD